MGMRYFSLAEYSCTSLCVHGILQLKPSKEASCATFSEVEQWKLDQWKTKLAIYVRYNF